VAKGTLVLEGVDVWFAPPPTEAKGEQMHFVYSKGGSLHVANCRFRSDSSASLIVCLGGGLSSECVFRNCEFSGSARVAVSAALPPCRKLVLENCVCAGQVAIQSDYWDPKEDVEIRLSRSTLLAPLWLWTSKGLKDVKAKPMRVETSGNVFDVSSILLVELSNIQLHPPLEPEAIVRRLVSWRGDENVYAVGASSIDTDRAIGPRGLADWQLFWKDTDANSFEGPVRYQGGNLASRLAAAPGTLVAEDFRLRPDSAGYRAGKDGKDLGADVDLVGPGAAYERWKKMPEYQQWLKESGQLKK
jgi:hypothetical protein